MSRALSLAIVLAACKPAPSPATLSSEVPIAGAWRPLSGLPATSRVRVATDPTTSVAPLSWQTCESKRPGCEVWLAPGARGDRVKFRPTGIEPVFEDSAGVHLSYLRRDAGFAHTVSVVQRLHGAAEAALWSPDGDAIAVATASRHGVAARVIVSGAPAQHYLGAASLAAAASTRVVAASLDASAPISQDFARGDGFIAIEAMGAAGDVRAAAFAFDDKAFVGGDAAAVALVDPRPVADGYVAISAEAAPRIVHVDRGGGRRTLVERPEARVIMAALDRTANDALVWVEEPFDDLGPPTLWTSASAPRQVASLAARGPIVANAGVVTYVVDATRARIVRLADGKAWDIEQEPGMPLVAPLWVNADAAWFIVSDVPAGEPGTGAIAGIVRIARAS